MQMLNTRFDFERNEGVLTVQCRNGHTYKIPCTKESNQTFRLGGTAVHEVMHEPCIVSEIHPGSGGPFTSYTCHLMNGQPVHGLACLLVDNDLMPGDAAYVVESYPLELENAKPYFGISRTPVKHPNLICVNVDCIDGGGNVIKRYRVCPNHGRCIVIGVNDESR